MSLKTVLFSLAVTLSSASLRAQEIGQSTSSTLPNEKLSSQQLLAQYATEYRPLDKNTNWYALQINNSVVEPSNRIDIRFAQDGVLLVSRQRGCRKELRRAALR